jgi:hypothetical protein
MWILDIDTKEIKNPYSAQHNPNAYRGFAEGRQAVLAHVHGVDIDELSREIGLEIPMPLEVSIPIIKTAILKALQEKLCSTQEEK